MIAPVRNHVITSPYGWRTLRGSREFHNGIDFISREAPDVHAITDGQVVYDQDDYDHELRFLDKHHSAGNMVIVRHRVGDEEFYVRYLHLGKNTVSKGAQVPEGYILGQYGDYGYSFGAHLHVDAYNMEWQPVDVTELFRAGGVLG